jgi:hypothetical protein
LIETLKNIAKGPRFFPISFSSSSFIFLIPSLFFLSEPPLHDAFVSISSVS